jgi:ABC-type transport system involved in multi-copper enzyme maturation permease subunit
MMFLPIVERELRVAARQWRTYWGRSIVGTVALAAVLHLIWVVYAGQLQGPGSGAIILKIVSYLALAFCLFSGANRTGDCLSSEKREDTLGLLFLTHLKGHDIVLGKLVASSLHAVLFLVSTLPILAIPVMLGGVSGSELVRVPLSLLNALLMSLAFGMLVSSISRIQRKAMLASSISLVFFTAILPGVAALLRFKYDLPIAALILSMPSPLFAHEMSLGSGFGLSGKWFWMAFSLQIAISIAATVAACLILPRSWQVKGDGAVVAWKQRLQLWMLGDVEQRRRRRTRLLERNPIFWLGARDRFGPIWPALFMITALCAAGACILYYEIPYEPAFAVVFVSLAITDFYIRGRVATLSALLFGRERQMGTWEMILSTPMTVREIIKGNKMAVRHHLLRTHLTFLLVYAVVVWAAMVKMNAHSANGWIALMFGVFSIGEFYVLCYAGMWRGMRAHNVVHAPGQALTRVMITPWFVWMLILPVIHEAGILHRWFDRSGAYGFMVVTCAIWITSTGLAFRRARRNLLHHFRDPMEAPSLLRFLKAGAKRLFRASPPESVPLLQTVLRN